MNKIEKDLLLAVADLHQVPQGAYNLRENGKPVERHSSQNIEITPKTDKSGIDITIKPNTINESVHIPVIITESGVKDLVYNDFYVGENSDVLIVAGCGIHMLETVPVNTTEYMFFTLAKMPKLDMSKNI